MPLVRLQLRNEYGLGKPELYGGESSREDPKAVLDGVAVAGLVGILRQLGDLAEFAAEVFHGLQEQAMTTASRSHNLMSRVQRIESALPPLEKRVLAQTSHIHFAYTAGSDWHTRIRNEQHHFIDNDLPRFIMDSYEECRDPPRLHLLDKFDTGGPGSCLRRYSDPTFFRRVSLTIDESTPVKFRRDKKARKIKKKRSFAKNGEFSRGTSISNRSSRLQFSSPIANGRASPTVSNEDLTFDSGMGDGLNSFDSRSGSGFIECIFSQSDNMQLNDGGSNRSSSSRLMRHEDSAGSISRGEESFSVPSIIRKKGFKASSPQPMQHEDSFGSVSREEESASVSSNMRKKVFKASPAQLMQHEDSVSSVSREEESASISSSTRKKSSKASSTQQMHHENSVGSVYPEEESASISSSMRKKGSKASSTQPMQHEDSAGSASQEEERIAISSSSHSPPMIAQEHRASDLSSVSWEEKTEIMQPNEPHRDEASELAFTHFNVGEQVESVSAAKTDEPDIQYYDQNISKSKSHEDQHDDVDSEVDNYVDALHTIESESETDVDYQTKREVEQFSSNPENAEIRVALEDLTSHSIDHHTSNVGSFAASGGVSDKGMPPDIPEVASSETCAEEQVPQVADVSAGSDILSGINVSENYVLSGPKVENVVHDPPSPGSYRPEDEISSSSDHQESPIKLAGVDFWTNGSLLGLQPAKPPVFAPSDNVNVDSSPSVPTSMQESDEGAEESHAGENNESWLSVKKPALVSSLSDLCARIDEPHHPNHSDISGHSNGYGLSSITIVAPGSAVPVAPTATVAPAGTTKENEENSPGVFGLSHRLFVNSFRKKLSLVYDEKPDLPTSDQSAVDRQCKSSHQTVVDGTCMDQFETFSPISSFPPSPPLEHMKISFHPVNDFETSMFGLRFSDENNSGEKVRDMFAFQLVPQPAGQLHGAGSYSDDDDDDDTFCRSSPCISDDYRSNHTDSNSEQWESDIYDASGRLSMESASAPTSYGNCEKEFERLQPDNSIGPLHSFPVGVGGPGLNLPSFDSIKCLPKQEKNVKLESMSDDLLQSHEQSTPPPPPLPPAEWRTVKPDTDAVEDEQEAFAAVSNAIDSNHLASRVLQQPKLTPVRPENFIDEIVQIATERKDNQKSNANKESFPPNGNARAADDKDDFLQQIRAKSFNLRRTVTAKPATTQTAASNVKVTAILEKANAIRQAVGSDDGEDDSWSDT